MGNIKIVISTVHATNGVYKIYNRRVYMSDNLIFYTV
jgi:hypothetical protein